MTMEHTGMYVLLETIKGDKQVWGRMLFITHSHNGHTRIAALANGAEHTITVESTKHMTVKEK